MELLCYGGTKICSNGPGHMTKMAAVAIYGKNLKKNLLRNQKANDLESWYVSSGAWVLQNLLYWWPWVDLDLFSGKVKFGPFMLLNGKKVKQWIFQKLLLSMWFETGNRWLKWQEVSVDIKTLSLGGCMPLPGGYIHVLNHEKKMYKIEIFLKLATMVKVIRPFCWHPNFVP